MISKFKILLYSIHDYANIGIRMLGAYLNKHGQDVRLCFLGSENGFSVREIIDAAKKITGIDFTVTEESRRSGDPAVLIASSEKIREELGWVPECSTVNEVISTAWKWHKGHPQGYEG